MMVPEPKHMELAPGERFPIDVIAATLTNFGIAAADSWQLAGEIIAALFKADSIPLNPKQRQEFEQNMRWAYAHMLWEAHRQELDA